MSHPRDFPDIQAAEMAVDYTWLFASPLFLDEVSLGIAKFRETKTRATVWLERDSLRELTTVHTNRPTLGHRKATGASRQL